MTLILEINSQKERILAKSETIKCHTSDVHQGKIASKKTFFSKKYSLFVDFCVHLESLLGWEYVYACHDLKTEKDGI